MHTIETTDPIEASRARYAQYRGRKATLTLVGSTVTGIVRPVNELGAGPLRRWIVTVFAKLADLYSADRSGEKPRPWGSQGGVNQKSTSLVNRERLG
jgi:hypothetical protein